MNNNNFNFHYQPSSKKYIPRKFKLVILLWVNKSILDQYKSRIKVSKSYYKSRRVKRQSRLFSRRRKCRSQAGKILQAAPLVETESKTIIIIKLVRMDMLWKEIALFLMLNPSHSSNFFLGRRWQLSK